MWFFSVFNPVLVFRAPNVAHSTLVTYKVPKGNSTVYFTKKQIYIKKKILNHKTLTELAWVSYFSYKFLIFHYTIKINCSISNLSRHLQISFGIQILRPNSRICNYNFGNFKLRNWRYHWDSLVSQIYNCFIKRISKTIAKWINLAKGRFLPFLFGMFEDTLLGNIFRIQVGNQKRSMSTFVCGLFVLC